MGVWRLGVRNLEVLVALEHVFTVGAATSCLFQTVCPHRLRWATYSFYLGADVQMTRCLCTPHMHVQVHMWIYLKSSMTPSSLTFTFRRDRGRYKKETRQVLSIVALQCITQGVLFIHINTYVKACFTLQTDVQIIVDIRYTTNSWYTTDGLVLFCWINISMQQTMHALVASYDEM